MSVRATRSARTFACRAATLGHARIQARNPANAICFAASLEMLVLQSFATPREPLVLAAVVFFMMFIGALATWRPVRRALGNRPRAASAPINTARLPPELAG